ncbi:MAG: ADOP family duplicated permease [Gammaproteobacteria bacterium]|nr:ADOP family duplicated permease [Gammaproteobacteria bacterium]
MSLVWPTELRQAVRSLARARGFAIVAVLVLGLGIGATATVFALVKQVLVDPLAYPDADRLVVVKSEVPGSGTEAEWGASSAEFVHFRENARSFADIGAMEYQVASVRPEGAGSTVRARIAIATAGVHRMLGARPVVGRPFAETDDDPGAPLAAVISRAFWETQFGADADVVGKKVHLDSGAIGGPAFAVPIIGVVEPLGEKPTDDTDIWLPKIINPSGPHYNQHSLFVVAKLRPDTTRRSAQTEIDGLTSNLPDRYPDVYWEDFMERFGFRTRLEDLKTYIVGDVAAVLGILFGAAGLLLAVGWADIACLLLARVETAKHDMAVRTALGAGKAVIARHFAVQSLLLAGAGGVLGCLVAWWLGTALVAANPLPMARLDQMSVDGGVVAFVAAVSLFVAVALALVAAGSSRDLHTHLADAWRGATASRSRQRARSALIAGQLALALVLIAAAGLLVASFRNLTNVDPGVDVEGVVKVEVYPTSRYGDHASWWDLLAEVRAEAEALPGVSVVGAASSIPFATGGCVGQGFADAAVAERIGTAELTTCADQDVVTPGYFEAMGIPLLRGRTLQMDDFADPARGSAVVSKAFAERFWPGEDPIGKRLAPHGRGAPWYTVVGLVGDVYGASLTDDPTVHVYYPLVQIPGQPPWHYGAMAIVVRTRLSEPTAVLPELRRVLRSLDPEIAVEKAGTMREVLAYSLSRTRFLLLLLSIAAGAALTLAVVGVYGVVGYLVARRSNEIGVRMALGATPAKVRRTIVQETARLLAIGLGLGLLASLVAGDALRGVLYGVAPTNPLVYVVGAGLLVCAALLASWIAAGRAIRLAPMDALRIE